MSTNEEENLDYEKKDEVDPVPRDKLWVNINWLNFQSESENNLSLCL